MLWQFKLKPSSDQVDFVELCLLSTQYEAGQTAGPSQGCAGASPVTQKIQEVVERLIPAGEAASGGEVEGQAGGTNLPHLEFICYGMKRFAARRIHLRRQEKICCTENLFAAAGKNLQHGEFIRGGRKTFAARRIHLRGQEKICGAGNALAVISKNLPPEELIPGGWKKSAARGIYLWR